jgi:hypothetical protein
MIYVCHLRPPIQLCMQARRFSECCGNAIGLSACCFAALPRGTDRAKSSLLLMDAYQMSMLRRAQRQFASAERFHNYFIRVFSVLPLLSMRACAFR